MSPSPSPPPLSEAEQIVLLTKQLAWAQFEVQALREQLRLQLIRKYGPKSEKLNDQQLQLLDLEPGVSAEEVEAESRREPLPAPTPVNTSTTQANRKSGKHPGRQYFPETLRRVEQIIACTPEQCVCNNCGKDKALIGYEQSEQLDMEPARFFVVVTRREKRACRACAEGVSAAPLPARIIDKGLASDRVVIDTLVNKYSDHLPLYRQSAILERETGVSISRATMDGWIMRIGEMLIPVTGAMKKELVAGTYIQADETPVPVQMLERRGKNHQAYLWQYGKPGGNVVFDFRMGRGRDGPLKFLGQYEGILQTDGYAAYGRVGGARIVHAACWAHARRKMFDAVKLNPDDRMARHLVARIDALFAVDADARDAGMDQGARHALRVQRSRPLLQTMKAEMEMANAAVLPVSALAKAANYTLALWEKLTRFLEHPELELSTNWAENSMRPVVLGRKNWIHVGSEQAGPKVAAVLSVMETCRRWKVPVREYLACVLPGLGNVPIGRIGQYTPAAWAGSRKLELKAAV